ncbi:osteopetrosis-associated transmembrane protein 1 isoform 2-T2 [Aulostomus maculatus]
MYFTNNAALLVVSMIHIHGLVSSGGVNATVSEATEKLATSAPLAAAGSFPVYMPGADSFPSLNMLAAFPEDQEISGYCRELLRIFGQRYVALSNCLVVAARPLKVCQNCFSSYGSLKDIYLNISSDEGPSNESCRDSLLRSDRLMLLHVLNTTLDELWTNSACDNCLTKGQVQNLSDDTLYFMSYLNQTLTCFETYQQGNHSELCKNCNNTYKGLNVLYGGMEKNGTMCIDIEDAMNVTRRLWSKSFNCSFPREETIPVIAVSSFMLFLPIIFYLSSFLHSEQKKRKLIHPKRAKSYSSLMNIQDKMS